MYPRVPETIEDPLEALLDLARSARAHLHRLGFVTAYGLLGGLLAAAALLSVGIIGSVLRQGEPIYLLAVVTGALSSVAVIMAVRVDRFLSGFDRRLRAIEGFVRFNPRPAMPEGATPVDRAVAWLERTDDRFQRVFSKSRRRLARDVRPLGPDSPEFSAHFLRKSMYLPNQYHLLIQTLDKIVAIEDLRGLKEAAQRMARKARVSMNRVLLVQTVPAEVPEDVERWLDGNWIVQPSGHRSEVRTCPIQILVEREDGRYEVAPAFSG